MRALIHLPGRPQPTSLGWETTDALEVLADLARRGGATVTLPADAELIALLRAGERQAVPQASESEETRAVGV